jgi:hypothetical protein
MLHGIRIHLVAASAVLITAPSLLAQGIYWESKSTGGPPVPGAGGSKNEKNYAVPKKFKTDAGDNAIIVRLDQEKMYMVDTKAKTYSEMTFAEMESTMKAFNAQMEEMMKKQLEGLPPEQRAVAEKQLADHPAFKASKEPKVEVTKTDEKREIAGRSCVKHVVKENGKEAMIVWTTTDLKEFEALRGDFTQLMKRMALMNPAGKGAGQAFEKIEGFPLETEMKGMMAMKRTATKVEPRSIPDSEFDVPQGFTKTKSPLESLPGVPPRSKEEPRLKELKERE